MKKLVFVLLIFISTASFAQKVRFGFHIDPSLAWLQPDIKQISFNGMKIGFNYGLIVDFNLSDNYALSTGLAISHNGGKISYDSAYAALPESFPNEYFPAGSKVIYNLQNLEIPIGLKLKTNQIGYITYFAHISGFTRLKLSAVGDVETPNSTNDINSEKILDDVRLLNFAWEVGGGIEYSLGGRTALLAGIYFNNGITDVTKPKKISTNLDGKVIGNYFTLRLGLLF